MATNEAEKATAETNAVQATEETVEDCDPQKPVISLENVDFTERPPKNTYANYFNSPRSLEAFKRTAIDPKELNHVNEAKLMKQLKEREHGKTIPQEIFKLRFNAEVRKRQKKIGQLKGTRQQIIEEQLIAMSRTSRSLIFQSPGGHHQQSRATTQYGSFVRGRGANASQLYASGGVATAEEGQNRKSQSLVGNEMVIIDKPAGVRNLNMTHTGFYNADSSKGFEQYEQTPYNMTLNLTDCKKSPETSRLDLARTAGSPSQFDLSPGRGSPTGSTMMEREMQQLERIKIRQMKEIEQVLDSEFRAQEIKAKNEYKQKLQVEKEKRRAAELIEQKKHRELQAEKNEQLKQQKALNEQQLVKQRLRFLKTRQAEQEKKQALITEERSADARRKAQILAEKTTQREQMQAQVIAAHEKAFRARQAQKEIRESQRTTYIAEQRREVQRSAERKRDEMERKIAQARIVSEHALEMQKKEFNERERRAAGKRKQFEQCRSVERDEAAVRAAQKQQEIEQAMANAALREEQRKQQIKQAQTQQEIRQVELARQKRREIRIKQRLNDEKAIYQLGVRANNDKLAAQRKTELIDISRQQEAQLKLTTRERAWQSLLRKEVEAIKREEKQETVERMAKVQQYKSSLIKQKIDGDAYRSTRLTNEKESVFQMRLGMRRDADRNKQDVMRTLDQMKCKGKMDPRALARFGINPDRFTSPSSANFGGTQQIRGKFDTLPDVNRGDRQTPLGMRNTELDSMPTTAAEVIVGPGGPHTRENTLSRNSGNEVNRIFSTCSAGAGGWTTEEKNQAEKGSPLPDNRIFKMPERKPKNNEPKAGSVGLQGGL